jgi:spoIIIJ-associated protein
VEWVETTGRSIEEAKDLALDQLGVDEQEAEFEILEEPTKGLFGRTRGEARVRARILPKTPPPKVERRERRRSSGRKTPAKGGSGGGTTTTVAAADAPDDAPPAEAGDGADGAVETAGTADGSGSRSRGRGRGRRGGASTDAAGGTADRPSPSKGRSPSRSTDPSPASPAPERSAMTTNDVTVQEQAEIISGFLSGLVDAFGLEGTIEQDQIDEDTIEVKVVGDDLGLLIGPKGNTLAAVQELSRTVVQRQASGTHHGRVRIDVGGYRQRRREALERFTVQVAEQVKESGLQKALEPMVASDRKVVHDTVNDIDGVRTLSEGEEPRRRVVIAPE